MQSEIRRFASREISSRAVNPVAIKTVLRFGRFTFTFAEAIFDKPEGLLLCWEIRTWIVIAATDGTALVFICVKDCKDVI